MSAINNDLPNKNEIWFRYVVSIRDAGTEKGPGGPSLKRALSKQQKGSFSVSSEAPTASGRRHLSRQSHNYITIFFTFNNLDFGS